MEVNFETVDAGKAKLFLSTRETQRPLSLQWAKQLAEKMVNGVWSETAEPIHFDRDGRLINGQHRLTAIELSGRPQKMLVVRGVDPESFSKMDQGKKRSAGETLAVKGFPNYNNVAAAVRILLALKKTGNTRSHTSFDNSEIDSFAEDHRNALIESTHEARACRDFALVGPMSASMFMILKSHRQKGLEFISGLKTGADLPWISPVLALRNRLLRLKADDKHPDNKSMSQMAFTAKAWSNFHKGKEVHVLTPSKSLVPDGFDLSNI